VPESLSIIDETVMSGITPGSSSNIEHEGWYDATGVNVDAVKSVFAFSGVLESNEAKEKEKVEEKEEEKEKEKTRMGESLSSINSMNSKRETLQSMRSGAFTEVLAFLQLADACSCAATGKAMWAQVEGWACTAGLQRAIHAQHAQMALCPAEISFQAFKAYLSCLTRPLMSFHGPILKAVPRPGARPALDRDQTRYRFNADTAWRHRVFLAQSPRCQREGSYGSNYVKVSGECGCGVVYDYVEACLYVPTDNVLCDV
jgi:hypothetical protein